MGTYINIGSNNGVLPDGTKLLPKLVFIFIIIYHL